MNKILSNILFIMLFLAPSSGFGMEPEPLVKIQTNDEAEFEIELQVAQTSETLKHMIEDIGEEAEQSIPLPEISESQFNLLLLAMKELAKLPMAELQASEEKLAHQLQQIVTDLKSNDQPLNNKQLIEFITCANYLDVPLVEPALEALARRILKKDELLQLVALEDKLKDLWHVHPAKLIMGRLSLEHPSVFGVIESLDGKNLISWGGGIIQLWDKNNLAAEPITLQHPGLSNVIVSLDGESLISWSFFKGTIKIWDKNNLDAEPIILKHPDVSGVIVSLDGKNFISWGGGIIQLWDTNNLAAEPITLQHPGLSNVIVCLDGNLISQSKVKGTIKIWDKNNLREPKKTLRYPWVTGVIESRDGNNLIFWGDGTIKIWNKNNLDEEPITLEHSYVSGVIESLDDKNLISWAYHQATIKIWDKNNLGAEPISLEHPSFRDVIESLDGDNLISWGGGTIKIWDKTYLAAEPIILQHQWVQGIIESLDGDNLISWGGGTIKIWDKTNLTAEAITLEHTKVTGVIESLDDDNPISWSNGEGPIKIWDKALLDPTPEQIYLLLAVYFVSEGNQKFGLPDKKLSELNATFNTLSPITQASIEKRAPNFIAAIKPAQK